MTVVSLVIGTCPTQMAASRVTATPLVPSVHSVSQRGGSVSAKLVWEVSAVILVAKVHMVYCWRDRVPPATVQRKGHYREPTVILTQGNVCVRQVKKLYLYIERYF